MDDTQGGVKRWLDGTQGGGRFNLFCLAKALLALAWFACSWELWTLMWRISGRRGCYWKLIVIFNEKEGLVSGSKPEWEQKCVG